MWLQAKNPQDVSGFARAHAPDDDVVLVVVGDEEVRIVLVLVKRAFRPPPRVTAM